MSTKSFNARNGISIGTPAIELVDDQGNFANITTTGNVTVAGTLTVNGVIYGTASSAIANLDELIRETDIVIPLSQTIGLAAQKSGVTITISAPAACTVTNHGFVGGSQVVFSTTGALPNGITAGQVYYVLTASLNAFTIAATAGGTAIATSGIQSGVHSVGPTVAAISFDNATIGDGVSITVLPGSKWTIAKLI